MADLRSCVSRLAGGFVSLVSYPLSGTGELPGHVDHDLFMTVAEEQGSK